MRKAAFDMSVASLRHGRQEKQTMYALQVTGASTRVTSEVVARTVSLPAVSTVFSSAVDMFERPE